MLVIEKKQLNLDENIIVDQNGDISRDQNHCLFCFVWFCFPVELQKKKY